ncbi:hypothetical protein AMAG_17668 [Allomyces macrogynus ATCC 38327]|uniref:Uncharacterized protein n=1 Tax=Allomyces macrogynus (strain ATCC 38327) TaxID=578462 RepID=A0A0L0RWE6_ALLM3|nr:hypothetical protein AMAG_17668 [Allomyces macrogynus ATCC 38327]|eukprot:KNE54396.1 hypothetical protein AMAG_17668 [Allomyces macrogynus ATCC 38327]
MGKGKGCSYYESGTNSSGNHWCNRGESKAGGNAYHYSNSDGSYYYRNNDGSRYYNNGKGFAKYTPPSSSSSRPKYYYYD